MLMGKFRDNMKWIMFLTAVTFVGLMVFGWGMDITGRSSTGNTGGELGRVNGDPITYQEWSAAYRNLYAQQQKSKPGENITAAENKQIEEAAWNQLVMQKLVNQELKRRGLTVSESELRLAARQQPPTELMDNPVFQTNGSFDIQKYYQFLSSPAVDNQLFEQLEAYYRDAIPRSKLFYQVTSGTYMPESEMWQVWRDAKETAKVRYLAIDPRVVVPDASVTVTQKEIDQYYKKHPDEFKRPATADVRYVVLDRSPNAADSAAALKRAQEARVEATKNFEDVAKRLSSDSISAKRGGNLGKVRHSQTVPAFDQAVFSLPIGQISQPILTQFGYHIVRVDSRTAVDAEVHHILIPITRSTENDERLLDKADSLEQLGQEMPIEKVAQRLGLRARQSELNDSTPTLVGVGPADDAAQWAFRDAEPNDVSEVFETPQVYYMVQLLSKREAGMISLGDATPIIKELIKNEKKLERSKEFGRTLLEKIHQGATLEAVAAQFHLPSSIIGPFTRTEFVPVLGRENAAVGTGFGLQPGQVSGLVESNGMLYIIQTVERNEPDRAEFAKEKAAQRGRLTQAIAEQRWTDFLAALKENAKIVDNRAALQKANAKASTNS